MSSSHVLSGGEPDEEKMQETLAATRYLTPVEDDTDASLVEAAKTDTLAFGELYERYYTRIYRYCFYRVGRVADAEDITGLVFMKALEALPSYEAQRGGFAPWIFRITRNAVVDHYRRRRQHAPLERAEWEEADSGDPAADALAVERRQDLQRHMAALSDEQRDVILMRYAADLTFPEIAAVLNKNEPAIRMLLHRGLRKLKTVMDHE